VKAEKLYLEPAFIKHYLAPYSPDISLLRSL